LLKAESLALWVFHKAFKNIRFFSSKVYVYYFFLALFIYTSIFHLMNMKHSTDRAWYENYFGPDYLLIDLHENTSLEVEFLYEILKLERGAQLLDVGCGYGRHLIPLQKRGVNVTGNDISRFMLQETIKNIKHEENNANDKNGYIKKWLSNGPALVQCDNRALPFYQTFDCACNMFNSFGYFKEERDNYRMLTSIADALKPGGLFLIDLANRDFVLRFNSRKDWFERNGVYILENKWFDPVLNRSEIDVTVIDKNFIREYHHSIRLYSYTELKMLLEAAGFIVRAVFGGFKSESFNLDHDRMLILAQTLETENE